MSRFVFLITHFIFIFIFITFFSYPFVFSQLSQTQTNTMITVSKLINNGAWSGSNPCQWKGVTCNNPTNDSVIQLSLSGFGLSSSDFLSSLCQIDSLLSIDVSFNQLRSIPLGFLTDCGKIDGLNTLNFSSNQLDSLPVFTGFTGLEALDFSNNNLSGNLRLEFDELVRLNWLRLGFNGLSGSIPTKLGKSNALMKLELSMNSFTGNIPLEIMEYKNLTYIDLGNNNLNGSIPDEIGNLSKLESLVLSNNGFSGQIPQTISNITTLKRFAAYQNQLTGLIPSGLTRYMKNLDLSYNMLHGSIPSSLLSQSNLETVDLSYNLLNGSIPEMISQNLVRLRLGSNHLAGVIPSTTFAKLDKLMYLELDNNTFTGSIPRELSTCRSLALLNLGRNGFTGRLPAELGDLANLQVMKLEINKLIGEIPVEFTKLSKLYTLNVSWNSLNGSIPGSISSLEKLVNMHLQGNGFSGSIPDAFGNWKSLLELQLGQNQFGGIIPTLPSSLQIALNLSNNRFEGRIPNTLSKLYGLEILDLSNNKFSGEIPEFLTNIGSLTKLILSNNQLSGFVPNFSNHVSVEDGGNPNLVNRTVNSKTTPTTKKKKSVSVGIVAAVGAAVLAVGLVAVIAVVFAKRFCTVNNGRLQPRDDRPVPQVIQSDLLTANRFHRSKIDFEEAMEAVSVPENVVLKTRFSTYYKTVMPSGTSYFVKKVNLMFQTGNQEKFKRDLEVLGKLSNTNIMVPLGYVLAVDSVYLFYEFAPKGTLFDAIRGGSGSSMDWLSRYSVAVGVAEGLAFLHGCDPSPILLLDLSSRSIMLKSLKEPQVGDIELCKVIDPSKSTGSLSTVAGSVGYIPPEYAYTMRMTMAGNVYSFGVVLLELLTGKAAMSGGTELAKWVLSQSTEQEKWDHILDYSISRTCSSVRSQMLAVLKVALACISVSPESRPKMKSVVGMLLGAR